jgi:hypothetical protein
MLPWSLTSTLSLNYPTRIVILPDPFLTGSERSESKDLSLAIALVYLPGVLRTLCALRLRVLCVDPHLFSPNFRHTVTTIHASTIFRIFFQVPYPLTLLFSHSSQNCRGVPNSFLTLSSREGPNWNAPSIPKGSSYER